MAVEFSSCLASFAVEEGYSTSDAELLDDFFIPSLSRASHYDRAVGYFSSSLVALAPSSISEFVLRGGKMRLVCSPHLSPTDIAWLSGGSEGESANAEMVAANIRALSEADDLAAALIGAMASLVECGALEVKFAEPSRGNGIFHDKLGVFRDECDDVLSFVGSANETAAAWSGLSNHEQLETFASWLSDEQRARAERHARQFEQLWEGVRRGVRLMDASASQAILREVCTAEPIEVSLEEVQRIIRERIHADNRSSSARPLRPHQQQVVDAWESAGRRGLVVFATGGGKTITGLAAARRHLEGGNPVVFAVPSRLLLRQWKEEIEQELRDIPVLMCGGPAKRSRWLANLGVFTDNDPSLGPRIVLTTYDTAVTDDWLSRVRDGSHLGVIADEVHRVGSTDRRKFLDLEFGPRMGLSATPERYGDVEGTELIFDYFGEKLQPTFGIKDAIEAGQLVPYSYSFETVSLLEEEQEEWDELSRKMGQAMARSNGEMTEHYEALARRRSRILKGAANKASMAKKILDRDQRPGDRWLVYCESRSHLQSVREVIETDGRKVLEYHSGNSELAPEIFEHFEDGGVLLAIKCLDEGVDLPFINRGIILASTTNPREHIQRRGRLLRNFPGKSSASLTDVIVVDDEGLPLVVSEVERAIEFAENASNVAGKVQLQLLMDRARGRMDWRRQEVNLEVEGE